jgi:hypothetical protein
LFAFNRAIRDFTEALLGFTDGNGGGHCSMLVYLWTKSSLFVDRFSRNPGRIEQPPSPVGFRRRPPGYGETRRRAKGGNSDISREPFGHELRAEWQAEIAERGDREW